MLYIIQKIKNIYYFVQAKKFIADDQFDRALESINKMESKDKIYFYIMRGTILRLLNDFNNSISDFENAILLLDNDRRRTVDEKTYLKAYIYGDLFSIYQKLLNEVKCIEIEKLYHKYEKFNIENIPKHVFEDFPISMNELWQYKTKKFHI